MNALDPNLTHDVKRDSSVILEQVRSTHFVKALQ